MMPLLARTTKSICHSTFRSTISIILALALALLSACDEGKEEPVPVDDAPSIISFTPTTGPAATEVVVSGKNFSATAAENQVKIGNVVATVTAATTTSVSIVIPSGAVTGKISVTVKGKTATSATDFVVPPPSIDFFTLTVDASYVTSDIDTWVLASSKSGEWIDVQPFEGGETKILNGIVPDGNTFTLHFLTVSQQTGFVLYSMKSMTDVPVNGAWLLKTVTSTPPTPQKLTLNVTNYNIPSDRTSFPNEILTVSSNEGAGSYSGGSSGTNVDREVDVMKSPADIMVTLYESGYPKYVSYKNVNLPTTINLDASTEGIVADRKFTMSLPANNYFYVTIDAFEQDQKYGYNMSKFSKSTGGTSVDLGYMQGYSKYRTLISYRDGKKSVDLLTTGPAVEEAHTFPAFDFTFTNPNLKNFQAVSQLPFDVVSLDFQQNGSGLVLLWNVVMPPTGTSKDINFKISGYPQKILDKYPALPSVDNVPASIIYGYQYMGTKTYSGMIDAASKSGGTLVGFSSDNYFRFAQTK